MAQEQHTPPFWDEEVNYLKNTNHALDSEIQRLDSFVETQKEDVLNLKKYYNNSQRDFDVFEFLENYARSDELVELGNEQIRKLFKLRNVVGKPYFGRVDFALNTNDKPLKLYIGLMSIEHNNTLYVVDWRAPVSELFYEFGKGPASYLSPNGKISGNVLLKRQYEISNGKLINAYDMDANLFDEYLQKVLANNVGAKLHNIASTIQEEQNQIIRNLTDQIVVVQGYAGCGKTTVALHRVAYALYRLRNLKSANVLLFSPNEAFLSHISGVLPELGEENTRSATFPKFIRRLLKTDLHIESGDEFTTRYQGLPKAQQAQIDCKLKFEMKKKLSDFINEINKNLHFDIGFKIGTHELGQNYLNDILEQTKGDKIKQRMEHLISTLCSELKIKDSFEQESLIEQVNKRINTNTDLFALLNNFYKQNGLKPLNDEQINYEDAVLLCTLKSFYQDIIIKMDVKHVVLDEAQDYPLLFIDFLIDVFKHSNFSIFGDIYQKTVPGELNSLADICKLKTLGSVNFVQMEKTYRSSEEIVEYATNIIGKPRHNVFRLKNNIPVEEIKLSKTVKEQAKQVLSAIEKSLKENKNIGIISGDIQTAKEIYDELSLSVEGRIDFVQNANTVVSEQIQIMPVALAKGLEFDTVVVIDKGKLFENENKRNLMYIACTRAINKLVVFKK